MRSWNVSHENWQVALRSRGKGRDEERESETDQRTDSEDDRVCVKERGVGCYKS